MVAKADIEKAKKANDDKPKFEDVVSRLWGCHDKHLERIEKVRAQLEEERFKKGGDPDALNEECKFHPEIYSREVDDEYRTAEQFVQSQLDFLATKNHKHE